MRFVTALALLAISCGGGAEDPAATPNEEVVIAPARPAQSAQSAQSGAAGASARPTIAVPDADPALLAQTPDERSPDEYRVVLETTKGNIEIRVHRAWSPLGSDRFYTLVKRGYFQDVAFFRVISGFMAQFGMHGNPQVNAAWADRTIADEPVTQSNLRGRITFAKRGMPNSRSNQFFINLVDNANLDGMGFSPFGEVLNMGLVERLHAGYGEGAPRGNGPSQELITQRGNAYLTADFPNLDYVRAARVVD